MGLTVMLVYWLGIYDSAGLLEVEVKKCSLYFQVLATRGCPLRSRCSLVDAAKVGKAEAGQLLRVVGRLEVGGTRCFGLESGEWVVCPKDLEPSLKGPLEVRKMNNEEAEVQAEESVMLRKEPTDLPWAATKKVLLPKSKVLAIRRAHLQGEMWMEVMQLGGMSGWMPASDLQLEFSVSDLPRYSPEAAYGLAQKGFWTSDTCDESRTVTPCNGAEKFIEVVFSTALNLRKVRIQQAASNHPQDFLRNGTLEVGGLPLPRVAADQPHCDSYQAIAPVVQREVAWSGALASPAHCLRIRMLAAQKEWIMLKFVEVSAEVGPITPAAAPAVKATPSNYQELQQELPSVASTTVSARDDQTVTEPLTFEPSETSTVPAASTALSVPLSPLSRIEEPSSTYRAPLAKLNAIVHSMEEPNQDTLACMLAFSVGLLAGITGWANVFLCQALSLPGVHLVGRLPCWMSSFVPAIDSMLFLSLEPPSVYCSFREKDRKLARETGSKMHLTWWSSFLVMHQAPEARRLFGARSWEEVQSPARRSDPARFQVVGSAHLRRWLAIGLSLRCEQQAAMDKAVEVLKKLLAAGDASLVVVAHLSDELPEQRSSCHARPETKHVNVLCLCGMALAVHAQSSCSRWLAIDTDAGVDDAIAICMALQLAERSNFELKLITTCFGNCSLEQVTVNVAKCLAAVKPAQRPLVANGAAHCLAGTAIDASHFHGHDGLGDAQTPEPPAELLPGTGAPGAVAELLALAQRARHEGADLILVTLGPLTNLALALRENPKLPEMLTEVFVMGCCGNGRGNHGRVTEFNVHADPEAAAEVFAASWERLTVASWELTVLATVPWPRFDRLLASNSEVGKFLAAIAHLPYVQKRSTTSCSRGQLGCWASLAAWVLDLCSPLLQSLEASGRTGLWQLRSLPGAIICDAVVMAMALRPEIIQRASEVHVEIELGGAITRGQTVVDWGTCFDGVHRPKHVRWVEEVDVEMLYQMLRETVGA
ncbi:NSNH [Symbiodinium sp. KB8]|nr:NSNH [Symbiodinium sp. KB8]